MTVGAVILAGGKSSRMNGKNKALLPWNGKSFLEHICRELREFDELWISADSADRYPEYAQQIVPDQFPGIGPIGAVYSALTVCSCDALLVTACDVPFFSRELAEWLISQWSQDSDAVVTEDRGGHVHPLCGVYQKSALPFFLEQIEANDYRMSNLLGKLRVKRARLCDSPFPDSCLQNINHPQDYRELVGASPAVIAVSGVKNSGKTTFLEKIIPALKEKDYRVAVIKHDGHDFEPDVPGTDSYRFSAAGADGVSVFSDKRYMLVRQAVDTPIDVLIEAFADMDLVLIEGLKDSRYPKIEIVRGEVSSCCVCSPETLLAVMTDTSVNVNNVPSFALDDTISAVKIIDGYVKRQAQTQEKKGTV